MYAIQVNIFKYDHTTLIINIYENKFAIFIANTQYKERRKCFEK